MRHPVAVVLLVSSSAAACLSVSPSEQLAVVPAPQAILESVAVSGLGFTDQRVVQVATASMAGSAGYATVSGSGTAVQFESFENAHLHEVLQRAIEDHRVARRIDNDAPVRIEGVVLRAESSTGFWRVTYDIVNGASFLWLFGIPFMGSGTAAVQLRVYDGDELLTSYTAEATADWTASIYMAASGPSARARLVAAEVAITKAVQQLVKDLPQRLNRGDA